MTAKPADASAIRGLYAKALAVIALGAALGFISAYVALTSGFAFGALDIGPWTAQPATGGLQIDPYARARMARAGLAPLGSSEGLRLFATHDSAGRALDGACDYAIVGAFPSARYWTLAVFRKSGEAFTSTDGPGALTSTEAVRGADNLAQVTLAARIRPGNWVAVPKAERFFLQLFVYEVSLNALAATRDALRMPNIERGACR